MNEALLDAMANRKHLKIHVNLHLCRKYDISTQKIGLDQCFSAIGEWMRGHATREHPRISVGQVAWLFSIWWAVDHFR